jgi:hypothetical protein
VIQLARKDAEKNAFFSCCGVHGELQGNERIVHGSACSRDIHQAMQRRPSPYQLYRTLSVEVGGMMAEPIMCPYCGGTNLFQEDDYGVELDYEYWNIHHWDCLDCSESFDKIEILPASSSFQESHESTIH